MKSRVIRNIKAPHQLARKVWNYMLHSQKLTSADADYWQSIKNSQKGHRGFVIGNGPSLTMSDLDALVDEVSIASNKIYLAFDKTAWRPTYYTVADPLVWDKVQGEAQRIFEKIHIPTYLKRSIPSQEIYWRAQYMGLPRRFCADLSVGAVSGQTVTFENIQLAVHLGLNPIYIIGCDHSYPGESNVTAGVPITQRSTQSHFVKNYRAPGEKVLPASIIDMEAAYREARRYCEKNNIEIFNATRGGKLEIFQRANLDEIIS